MGGKISGQIKKDLDEMVSKREELKNFSAKILGDIKKEIRKANGKDGKKAKKRAKKILNQKVRIDFLIGEMDNLERRVESLINEVDSGNAKRHKASITIKRGNIQKVMGNANLILENEENVEEKIDWSEDIEREYDRVRQELIKEGKIKGKKKKKGKKRKSNEGSGDLEEAVSSSTDVEKEFDDLSSASDPEKKVKKGEVDENEGESDDDEEEDVKEESSSEEESSSDDDSSD